jgi:hypothetical protein
MALTLRKFSAKIYRCPNSVVVPHSSKENQLVQIYLQLRMKFVTADSSSRSFRATFRSQGVLCSKVHMEPVWALFAFWQLPRSYLRAACALSLSKMTLHSISQLQAKRFTASAASRLSTSPTIIAAARCPLLQLPSSLMDHNLVPSHLVTQ